MSRLPWPTARASHDAVATQFDTDRAVLMHWALTTGDPLADPVARRIAEGERGLSAALEHGLRDGLATLEQPDPDLAALLDDLEQAAAGVESNLGSSGSEAFHSVPPAVHIISLSVGSLVRVYESPSIAAVLSSTGRLVDGADARLRETAKWLGEAMLPGALRVGAPGYIATAGVRMLHAKVRYYATRGDYDAARYGVPINQVDLGRTWMDFTLTSWQAEARLGYALTGPEIARAYRLWGYVGRLLGVDPRLTNGITTHVDACRMDAIFSSVTGPLTEESAILTEATIESVAVQLRENIGLPTALGRLLLRHLTFRFHGPAKAEKLGVPRAWIVRPLVSGAIAIIRARRRRLRDRPDAWSNMIARNQLQLRKDLLTLAEKAEYETLS